MTNRAHHSSSAAYDRLLDATESDGTPLAELLAAARAPARPGQLTGMATARAAFERAHMGPARGRAPVSVPTLGRRAAGRVLAVKVIALIGGASVVGGAAYAAADIGLLPGSKPSHHAPAPSHPSEPGLTRGPVRGGPIPGATSVVAPATRRHHTSANPATPQNSSSPTAAHPSAPSSPHPTHPTHPPHPTTSGTPSPTKSHPSHGRGNPTPPGSTKADEASAPHPIRGP